MTKWLPHLQEEFLQRQQTMSRKREREESESEGRRTPPCPPLRECHIHGIAMCYPCPLCDAQQAQAQTATAAVGAAAADGPAVIPTVQEIQLTQLPTSATVVVKQEPTDDDTSPTPTVPGARRLFKVVWRCIQHPDEALSRPCRCIVCCVERVAILKEFAIASFNPPGEEGEFLDVEDFGIVVAYIGSPTPTSSDNDDDDQGHGPAPAAAAS
jgi:hypothetical protein